MNKSLLATAALMLLVSQAMAQVPHHFVALYGDTVGGPGGSSHSVCGIDYVPAPYTEIEMWVWWLPDPEWGLRGVDYKLVYPTSTYIIPLALTSNPDITVDLGTPANGIQSAFGSCWRDWCWSHWQYLFVKKMAPMTVQIVGNPNSWGTINVVDCTNGMCSFPATLMNHLSINAPCNPVVGTKDASWGKIKSLYQ